MQTSFVGAVIGMVLGILVALVLFSVGPRVIEWMKGTRLETEAWVFYITAICGAGFGAVTGAAIGAAKALADTIRGRS